MAALRPLPRRGPCLRWLLAMLLGATLAGGGCSDDSGPDEVVFSSRVPRGLTVRGTVHGSTLAGARGAPLAGADVYLSGAAEDAVLTDARGEYSFTDLPPGVFHVLARLDGHQSAVGQPASLLPEAIELADGTTVTVDLDLRSNPVLVAMSPLPGATVDPAALELVAAFNEPMQPGAAHLELWLLAPAGADLPARRLAATSVWDEGGMTLRATPEGGLPAGATLDLRLVGAPLPTDLAGYPLDLSGSGGGLSTDHVVFRTAAGGAPGAVAGLRADLGGDPPPALDWPALQALPEGAAQVPLRLEWAPAAGGPPVVGHQVRARCGLGPTLVVAELGATPGWDTTLGALSTLLFPGTGELDPVLRANVPAINCLLELQVVAESTEGGGPPSAVALLDQVPPSLVWAERSSPGAGLPDLSEPGRLYLGFSEPVVLVGPASASFSVAFGEQPAAVLTAEVAHVRGVEPLVDGRVFAVVLLGHEPGAEGDRRVAVLGGVRDLAGNELLSGAPGSQLPDPEPDPEADPEPGGP